MIDKAIEKSRSGRPVPDEFGLGWTGPDGNHYRGDIGYELSEDSLPIIVRALKRSDPEQSKIRRRLNDIRIEMIPKLGQTIDEKAPHYEEFMDLPLWGDIVPRIQPYEVSTVIMACHRVADRKGIIAPFYSETRVELARHIADELGQRVATDFGYQLRP